MSFDFLNFFSGLLFGYIIAHFKSLYFLKNEKTLELKDQKSQKKKPETGFSHKKLKSQSQQSKKKKRKYSSNESLDKSFQESNETTSLNPFFPTKIPKMHSQNSVMLEELESHTIQTQNEISCLTSLLSEDLEILKYPSQKFDGILQITIRPFKLVNSLYFVKLRIVLNRLNSLKGPNFTIVQMTNFFSKQERKDIDELLFNGIERLSKLHEPFIYDVYLLIQSYLNEIVEKYEKNDNAKLNSLYDEIGNIETLNHQNSSNTNKKTEEIEETKDVEECLEIDRKESGNVIQKFKERMIQDRKVVEDEIFLLQSSSFLKKNSGESENDVEKKGFKLKSRYYNDFQEVEMIGEGGSAQVFKVRNKLDGNNYAIKKVEISMSNVKNFQKIIKEVTLLSRLHHHHIVRYYQAWVEDNPNECDIENSSEEEPQSSKSLLDENDAKFTLNNENSFEISFEHE